LIFSPTGGWSKSGETQVIKFDDEHVSNYNNNGNQKKEKYS
jgi:hypothetical protein